MTPLSAERYALQVTLGKAAREDLQRAQDLLGSEVAPGDIAEVLGRALRLLVSQLEKRKCAATAKPRPARRPKPGSRHVPASVRRAVWERDGGRCAFVGNGGHRCTATRGLEYDHVEPVARGGTASVDGIRLLCRAHNQFEAERTYGAAFMDHKRRGPREIAARRSTAASPRG